MKKNQGKEVVEQEELTYTKKIENDPNFQRHDSYRKVGEDLNNRQYTQEQLRERRISKRRVKGARRGQGLDVSDDSSDGSLDFPGHDIAIAKTGYELTPYMNEYNAKTEYDYTEGYDPAALDQHYRDKEECLYKREKTVMPNEVNFTFDIKFSGVDLNEDIVLQIKESFEKFQSDNLT